MDREFGISGILTELLSSCSYWDRTPIQSLSFNQIPETQISNLHKIVEGGKGWYDVRLGFKFYGYFRTGAHANTRLYELHRTSSARSTDLLIYSFFTY